MKSTVKCWSENLPRTPWAFPLYQQDRGEHLQAPCPSSPELCSHSLDTQALPIDYKWTRGSSLRVRHTLGDSLQPLGSKWPTSNKPLKTWSGLQRNASTSCERHSPANITLLFFTLACLLCLLWQALIFLTCFTGSSSGDNFSRDHLGAVVVSLCQPLLQAFAAVSSKRAARGWLVSATPKHLI